MPVHGLLVQSVDLRSLRGSAVGNDPLGDGFDGCQVAPGEKKIGPLRRKGVCNSAADRAAGSVDHRNLILQHHLWFLSVPGGHTLAPRDEDGRLKLIRARLGWRPATSLPLFSRAPR